MRPPKRKKGVRKGSVELTGKDLHRLAVQKMERTPDKQGNLFMSPHEIGRMIGELSHAEIQRLSSPHARAKLGKAHMKAHRRGIQNLVKEIIADAKKNGFKPGKGSAEELLNVRAVSSHARAFGSSGRQMRRWVRRIPPQKRR